MAEIAYQLLGTAIGLTLGAGILWLKNRREQRRMDAYYHGLAQERLARFDAFCEWVKTASDEELEAYQRRRAAEEQARRDEIWGGR